MSSRTFLAAICFFGTKLGAVEEALQILSRDDQRHIFQVKSLNQFDSTTEGDLAKTACGYYAINNCIEIMNILRAPLQYTDGRGVGTQGGSGLNAVRKGFEAIDSEQRAFIIARRARAVILNAATKALSDVPRFKQATQTDQERIRSLCISLLQRLFVDFPPIITNNSISRIIPYDALQKSFINICKEHTNHCNALWRVFSEGKNMSNESLCITLWESISNQCKEGLSCKNSLFSYTLHPSSEKIAQGNWLDSGEVESLIDFIEKRRTVELEISALNMAGRFPTHYRNYKESAAKENATITYNAILQDYELVNYHYLKKLKEKLVTTHDDVIEGFVINLQEFHWISLVIVRLNGGDIKYYVADSFANTDRVDYFLVHDIIRYIQNAPPRNGSQFEIPSVEQLSTLSYENAYYDHIYSLFPQRTVGRAIDSARLKRVRNQEWQSREGWQPVEEEQLSIEPSEHQTVIALVLGGMFVASGLLRPKKAEQGAASRNKKKTEKKQVEKEEKVEPEQAVPPSQSP